MISLNFGARAASQLKVTMPPESGAFPMGRFERIYGDPSNGCSPELTIVANRSVTLAQIAPYGLCVFRLTDG